MATNNFDPTKYGATPFDPKKFGATPVNQNQISPGIVKEKQQKGFGGFVSKVSNGAGQGLGQAGQTALGAVKQIGNDIVGVGKAVSTPLNAAYKGVTGKEPTFNAQPQANITPNQKPGSVGAQLGEFMAPGGATSEIGKLASAGGKLAELGTKAVVEGGLNAGITAAQGGTAKDIRDAGIAGAALPVASKALKTVGKGLVDMAIPTSAKEAKLLQNYKADNSLWKRVFTNAQEKPSTMASTAFDKNLIGTESMVGVQAKREADNIWGKTIKPALDNSKEKVSMPKFFDDAEKEIIQNNPEISRQKDLLNALNAFKEDYSTVGDVDLKTLQKFKEGWAKFVPEKAYKGLPIAGAFNEVKDTLADIARNKIHTTLGSGVKKAYFDYGNLKGLQELGQKAMTDGRLKGGFGSFWSAIKDMALVPVGTIGGQAVYKVGKGVELYGKAGAKTVKDIINPE